ncbi:MAG: IS110 family transposase, partial [Anaerolineales bacterium]|nr:IS110 family transposase [Anaerolineales bacterium]
MTVRYIGLDIHKRYLVAYGVNREQEQVYGPRRVEYSRLKTWIQAELRPDDEVVVEMTTNTWHMVDLLEPHVGSVLVVHPPEVKSIVKARVMTDKKAARILARLHAAKLLPAVWVPPKEVREIRSLVAGRRRMVSLGVRAKNALHNILHAHHIETPEVVSDIFHPDLTDWWASLPIPSLEAIRVAAELDNIAFAQRQKARFEMALYQLAAKDERVPLLAQLPGIGALSAITILGAIGTIERFPNAQKLVGYAGLGAGVHSSGESHRSGRITKTGR